MNEHYLNASHVICDCLSNEIHSFDWLLNIDTCCDWLLKKTIRCTIVAQVTFNVSTLHLNELYVTTPYVQRLQCGTWTDREAVIACRSKQVILILFMAIKTWWRSRIYWLPWKIMLVHNISCPSNRCLVYVWCTTQTCIKFFQPWVIPRHAHKLIFQIVEVWCWIYAYELYEL